MQKSNIQKALSVLLICSVIFVAFISAPGSVKAASHSVADGESLNLTTGVLTRSDNSTTNYTIIGGDTIMVADGASATITGSANVYISCGSTTTLTITNVSIINTYSSTPLAPLAFSGTGNTLILEGTNSLSSYAVSWNDSITLPGVEVVGSAALTIKGTGSLTADGGGISSYGGAGIGGGANQNAGTIIIDSGTIIANGGYYSAGIGAGKGASGSSGTITINNGHVTASAGNRAAGIGGSGGDGSSTNASHGGIVTVNNGTVVANAGNYAAGIGGGWYGSGGSITINNGHITATGGGSSYGAGIGGGGNGGDGGTILITGGTVIARGKEGAAGIGGGFQGEGGSISIQGGTIDAQTTNNGAGIGGGMYNASGGYMGGNAGTITISEGTIVAIGMGTGAGIGNGGSGGTGGTITISGGTIEAIGGNGAGIGRGSSSSNGTINISGTPRIFAKGNLGDISGTITIAGTGIICMNHTSALGGLTTTTHSLNTSPDKNNSNNTIESYSVPSSWLSNTNAGYFPTSETPHSVTFEENGGSAVSDLNGLLHNSKINAPTSTRSGYDNAEWYQDSAFQNPWVFDSNTVTSDITLYAHWLEVEISASFLIDGDSTGQIIGTFTDNDTAYSLENGTIYPDNSAFTISGNTLSFVSAANIGSKSSYTILVRLVNASGENLDKEITITVKQDGTTNGGQAVSDTVNVAKNGTVEFSPEINDSMSSFGSSWGQHFIISPPEHGTAEIGSIIYTPETDFTGSDSITYLICDDANYCMRGSADITVGGTTTVTIPDELPASGFAPNIVTTLPTQNIDYSQKVMSLRIPELDLETNIVGIPGGKSGWDVTWLGEQAGWLEGTAYPTWEGNTAITGHAVNAEGQNSIFSHLENLKYDDLIFIDHAGKTYTYAVRENKMVMPDNLEVLEHEDYDWLTLITCKTYMESWGGYAYRSVIKAVLINIE